MQTLKDLLIVKMHLEEESREIKERQATNAEEIARHVESVTAKVRKLQGKEFGAVNAIVEGYRVTETIPKEVKWDNEQMMGVYLTIKLAGDDPFKYMKAKFSVAEKDYSEFMPEVKAVFDVARTIVPGKPAYKFEEVGDGA